MNADGGQGGGHRPVRDINALLGSRICHDLISPLGAISNGVELLSMSGISAAPELSLIADSVDHANARIRAFRIAYGSARDGQTVPVSEIAEVLVDLGRSGRLKYRWSPAGELPRPMVKLAFLLLQCLESAMPFGGEIEVSSGPGPWRICGRAARMKVNAGLWELIDNPSSDVEVDPANVHFALIEFAALNAGCRVQVEVRENEIQIVL